MKAFAFCMSLVWVIATMPFPGWHDVSLHTNVRLYPGTAHSSLSFRTTQPAALISGSFLMFLGGPSGARSATIRFCVGDDPALEFGEQVALQHPVPAQSRSSSNQIDERTTPCFFAILGCETLQDSSSVLGILESVICPENMLFSKVVSLCLFFVHFDNYRSSLPDVSQNVEVMSRTHRTTVPKDGNSSIANSPKTKANASQSPANTSALLLLFCLLFFLVFVVVNTVGWKHRGNKRRLLKVSIHTRMDWFFLLVGDLVSNLVTATVAGFIWPDYS